MRALVALGCAGLLACSVYTEDLLLGSGGGGGAGGSVECSQPADCPGSDGECGSRTCSAGSCGMDLVTAGTACTEAGGKVCDGQGACVECVTSSHCAPTETCSSQVCVAENSLANGEACTAANACQSNVCVDGVCCNAVCAGFCQACDVAGSLGTCTDVPAGSDPDDECGADVCNGQGECRCDDGSLNGSESDVDCGGTSCPACGFGQDCNGNGDCQSNSCQAGTCAGVCGDNQPQGTEECDDGNTNDFDGCSPLCLDPVGHLLISEFAVSPANGEFIEIFNPTGSTVSLADVYLADFTTYYLITTNNAAPNSADFVAHFPAGSTIAAGSFVVVSMKAASLFNTTYGFAPDYELPALAGVVGSTAGLTDTDEMIVLFRWSNGDLVTDLDYVVYGDTSDAMDKSGVTVGASTYQPETAAASQVPADNPGSGKSTHRCDTAEASESKSGGNGSSGHDETSENGPAAWKIADQPTPKAAPPPGFCP